MKAGFLSLLLFLGVSSFAQQQDAVTLQETAKTFLQQGDYENAILVLNKALQLKSNDLGIAKDLEFAYYLKRDFAKALETGKPLVERGDADVPAFQMLGLVYKALAEDKEADKLYKAALKKFPNEGVLYSEYGELLASKDAGNATKLWEKGIDADPNHSGNYFHLTRQYARQGNLVWSILYGEMFLNMESFTARSTEIKNVLLDQYKKFFSTAPVPSAGSSNGFVNAVTETLYKQHSQVAPGITPDVLTVVRTRFILDWYEKHASRYPFRLFQHQQQLLQQGMFEAYNQWLFGPALNLQSYQNWQRFHKEQMDTFMSFIRRKMFKVPPGEQYRMP